MIQFNRFIKEIKINNSDRKGILVRKININITDVRLNYLYKKYFSDLINSNDSFQFKVDENDLSDILFILRYHFQLWIELEGNKIIIFKDFPKRFKIKKDVNKDNHWFVPETIKKGTIMYSSYNNYGTSNRLNGIPLSKSLNPIKGTNMIPSTQINYEFIEPLYKL